MRANIYLNHLSCLIYHSELPNVKTSRLRAIEPAIVNILITEEVLAGCRGRDARCGCCAPQMRRLQGRQQGRDGDEDRRVKKQIMLTDSMIG
jgi:hypothetical protein